MRAELLRDEFGQYRRFLIFPGHIDDGLQYHNNGCRCSQRDHRPAVGPKSQMSCNKPDTVRTCEPKANGMNFANTGGFLFFPDTSMMVCNTTTTSADVVSGIIGQQSAPSRK